jgi:PAS domain-containing protein
MRGARAEGNSGQVLVASERTIQSAYDHADRGHERAQRHADRPSSVRRRTATYESESLSTSAYLAALAAATDGVLLINRAGVVVYSNPAAETFFADDSLSGQFFSDVTALDRRTLNGIWRELHRVRCWRGRLGLRSQGPDVEVTVQRVTDERADGENFCVVLHGAARADTAYVGQGTSGAMGDARSEQSDVSGLLTTALEASELPGRAGRAGSSGRKDLQTALQRVASEIAHDFNNQIAVILNYTFVLLRQMPADSPLKAHVSEMQTAAWRASQVAQAIHRALVTHATHTLLPSGE